MPTCHPESLHLWINLPEAWPEVAEAAGIAPVGTPSDPADVDAGSTNGDADPIQGARLLMVEDNPVNMMIAVALLEQWGAKVSQAGDGEEAVAAVDEAVARGHGDQR